MMRPVVVLVILAALAVLFLKRTIWSLDRTRSMRWKIRLFLHPGPGFASLAEIHFRWSRLAALGHGRRARPSMRLHRRLVSRTTRYAVRLGRSQWGRRVFARAEDQTIILSLPRVGKSGLLADRVIEHPGPALVAESRSDMYTLTAGYRSRLGPLEVFNPRGVSGIPSTFRWNITAGCADPAEALLRADGLVGAVATGDMQWWSEKSAAALAAAMHAADLLGGDMRDVWAWTNSLGYYLIDQARQVPGASLELFGCLAELDKPTRGADSIKLTMSKALKWMAVPEIRAMVTGPEAVPFDVARFTAANGTIYMMADGESSPVAPLFRCFTSYVHREAGLYGLSMPRRKLDPGLLIAIDELHACPVDLPAWLADSAGKGIQVVAVIHSTGQLRDKYGEHGADTVWSTAGTKLFLPGIHDPRTLEDVSRLCGTIRTADGSEPAVPVEVIRTLPDWTCLALRTNLDPAAVRFRPAWRRLDYRLRRPPLPVLHADQAPALQPLDLQTPEPVSAAAEVPEFAASANGHGSANGHSGTPGPRQDVL
jgi:type IV secretion system protein VirD4